MVPYLGAMGLFRRKQPSWVRRARGTCGCAEHVDDLADLVLPLSRFGRKSGIDEELPVGDLVGDNGDVGADALDEPERFPLMDGRPAHRNVWIGDAARLCYDDDAGVSLEEALASQPGVESVYQEDRERFYVDAPTLCEAGVLAVAIRALADPRGRG